MLPGCCRCCCGRCCGKPSPLSHWQCTMLRMLRMKPRSERESPEPEDGAALLDEITMALRRHVVMTLPEAQMVALWIMHAHTIDAHQHSPRLAVTSPMPNCGKTTLCSVIALLTSDQGDRPTRQLPHSSAGLSRDGPRVVILDEADTFFECREQDRNRDLELRPFPRRRLCRSR